MNFHKAAIISTSHASTLIVMREDCLYYNNISGVMLSTLLPTYHGMKTMLVKSIVQIQGGTIVLMVMPDTWWSIPIDCQNVPMKHSTLK